MKAKQIVSSNVEVLTSKQLSKITGGKTIYIIIGNQRIPIEVPD